jgi:uncharacterized protein YdaU (DUF1376 family)
MAEYPALPLFTDAYLGDTLHLSLEEHGAYLKLLMIAWRSGDCSIQDDDPKIARMLGVSLDRWRAKLRPAIEPFWAVDGGRWTQKRLTKEREKVQNFKAAQREKAKARWNDKPLEPNGSGDAGASNGHIPATYLPTPSPTPDSESQESSRPHTAAAESVTHAGAAEAAPPDPLPDLLREVHDRTSVSGVTMPRLEREVAAWVAELGRETVAAILAEALRSARRDVLALASTIVADRSVKLHAAKAAAIHASTAPPRPTAGDLARAMLAETDRASPLAELPHAAGLH